MRKILAFLSVVLLLSSCSSDDQPALKRVTYVAGIARETSDGNDRAALWKDGVVQYLTPANRVGEAYDVLINGKDVHVVGFESNANGINEARHWKNGVNQTLNINTTVPTYALDMCLYNGDLYVLGRVGGAVKYWKNGVLNDLANMPSGVGTEGIFVTSYGVYVSFIENGLIKVWHDGVINTLSNGQSLDRLRGFYVSGADVYVLADESKDAIHKIKYWKNGVVHYLPNLSNAVQSSYITVVKGNVYIAGMDNYVVKYWVNGKPVKLNDPNGMVWGLSVFKGDVYAVGTVDLDFKIWENGKDMKKVSNTAYENPYDIAVAEEK